MFGVRTGDRFFMEESSKTNDVDESMRDLGAITVRHRDSELLRRSVTRNYVARPLLTRSKKEDSFKPHGLQNEVFS